MMVMGLLRAAQTSSRFATRVTVAMAEDIRSSPLFKTRTRADLYFLYADRSDQILEFRIDLENMNNRCDLPV